MNLVLKLKVKAALGKDWSIHQDKSGYIFFKDRKQRANYSLYAVGMNQDQILKIAQIVGRVFAGIDKDNRLRTNHEVPTQNLNSTSELSQQYVARVLNLDGSNLHKLFLLASGAFLSSPGVDDLLITLAESKKEDPDGFQVEITDRIFETLQEIYVLPGISPENATYSARAAIRSAVMRHPVDMVARLLSFVTSQAYRRTLADHLSLSDESAYKADKIVDMFDRFSFIEKFIARKVEYKNLALKLNSTQIYSLSLLMYSEYSKIPEDFLYNRAIAMRNKSTTSLNTMNISDYLSFKELSLTSSPDEMTKINKLTSQASPKFWPRTPIVYAAIGEVLVQKGYDRAIEVIKEISKASYLGESYREYTGSGTKYVEDTVLLILEALNSDNDEMPFSWAAQISEYGWILSAEANNEDLTLKV